MPCRPLGKRELWLVCLRTSWPGSWGSTREAHVPDLFLAEPQAYGVGVPSPQMLRESSSRLAQGLQLWCTYFPLAASPLHSRTQCVLLNKNGRQRSRCVHRHVSLLRRNNRGHQMGTSAVQFVQEFGSSQLRTRREAVCMLRGQVLRLHLPPLQRWRKRDLQQDEHELVGMVIVHCISWYHCAFTAKYLADNTLPHHSKHN